MNKWSFHQRDKELIVFDPGRQKNGSGRGRGKVTLIRFLSRSGSQRAAIYLSSILSVCISHIALLFARRTRTRTDDGPSERRTHFGLVFVSPTPLSLPPHSSLPSVAISTPHLPFLVEMHEHLLSGRIRTSAMCTFLYRVGQRDER